MFEQAFKNIDDILHKDAGCSSELDYVEQTSWILFLKYLDDLEKEKKSAAGLRGKPYTRVLSARNIAGKFGLFPRVRTASLTTTRPLTGDDLKGLC